MRRLVDLYHSRPELVSEQSGWTKTITLVSTDRGDAIAVRLVDGKIVSCEEAPHGGASGDVIVSSDFATLADVLALKRSPNEPYVFGDLTVRGAEADFTRLDYLLTRLADR